MADNAGKNKSPPKSILKTRRNVRGAAGAGGGAAAPAPRGPLRFANATQTRVFNFNEANKANMSKQYRNMVVRSKTSYRAGINIPQQAEVNRNRSGRARNLELIKKYHNQPNKLAAVQQRLQQRHSEAQPVAVGVGAVAQKEARAIQAEFEAQQKKSVAQEVNDELNELERELEFIQASARKQSTRPASAAPVRPAPAAPAVDAAGGGGSPLAAAGAALSSSLSLPPLAQRSASPALARRSSASSSGGLNLSRLGAAAPRSASPAPRASITPLPSLPVRAAGFGAAAGTAVAAGGLGASGGLGAGSLRGLLGPPGSLPAIQPRPAQGGPAIGAALGGLTTTLPSLVKKSPQKPQGGGKRKTRKNKKSRRNRRK